MLCGVSIGYWLSRFANIYLYKLEESKLMPESKTMHAAVPPFFYGELCSNQVWPHPISSSWYMGKSLSHWGHFKGRRRERCCSFVQQSLKEIDTMRNMNCYLYDMGLCQVHVLMGCVICQVSVLVE